MVAAVGGFLFGYDLSIISGAMVFIKPAFGLNPHQVGLAMGSALLGCMAGPLVGGPLGDRWGRKRTLILAGLLFAAGAIGTAMPSGIVSFSLFRFLGGVAIGLASVVSPMFIAEMSPPRIRGGLVTVNQLAIVVGGACAVVVSYSLSFHGQWQWMLASNAAPVPLFIVGLLLVPESPRWLAQKNRLGEALDVLTLIDGSEHAETEMKDILASNEDQGSWRRTDTAGNAVRHVDRLRAGGPSATQRRQHSHRVHAHRLPGRRVSRPQQGHSCQRHPQYLVRRLHHRGLAAGRSPRPQAASADWHRRHGRGNGACSARCFTFIRPASTPW